MSAIISRSYLMGRSLEGKVFFFGREAERDLVFFVFSCIEWKGFFRSQISTELLNYSFG